MHIEVREIKGKKKFYLAHSFRKFGKVRKARFFLGYNLSKKQIERKAKAARKAINERLRIFEIIRDPLHTVISPAETREIKLLEKSAGFRVFHLSDSDWKIFIEEFAYDTNAIEGSTVTLPEVAGILEKKISPEGRKLWEVQETYGVAEAVSFIRETKEHLSIPLMKKLHKIIFRKSKKFAGKLREKGKEVAVVDSFGNIIHRGAPSAQVLSLLKELVAWYNKNKKKYSPLVLAAVVHNQFENIHPFEDGNGRVGRLLLNSILLKHGHPPVNIELKKRKDYYAALREYQENFNLRPTIEFLLNEYKAMRKLLKR